MSELNAYRGRCSEIYDDIDWCLKEVHAVEANYQTVADRSKSLQEACERLLEQQLHLASLAESLADRLSYFNELEAIARLINTPGDAVVLHDRFVPSLTRLDQCLAYVEANVRSWDSAWRSPPFACRTFARVFTVSMPGWLRGRRTPRMQSSFRDAELYKMKFRQCLTRGLTLIKLYVADVLKALLTELTQRLAKDKVGPLLCLRTGAYVFVCVRSPFRLSEPGSTRSWECPWQRIRRWLRRKPWRLR